MLRYAHGPFGVIAVAGGGPAGFRLDIGGLSKMRPVKPAGQLPRPVPRADEIFLCRKLASEYPHGPGHDC